MSKTIFQQQNQDAPGTRHGAYRPPNSGYLCRLEQKVVAGSRKQLRLPQLVKVLCRALGRLRLIGRMGLDDYLGDTTNP